MKQKENNSYIMNDLHAMDALHEHIAMVLYCTNSSAKSISMDPFHTVNFYKFAMVTIILPKTFYFYNILEYQVNHKSEL